MAEQNYPGPPLITAHIPTVELKLLKLNFESHEAAVVQRAIDWAVGAGVDTLEHALPLTPWDTGILRESGTVTMDLGNTRVDVASGRRDSDNIQILSGMNKLTPQLSKRLSKRVRWIRAIVHFHRVSDSNEGPRDVALWAHENLNPYGSDTPPSARKPGTGPKYLEKAFKQRGPIWNSKRPMIEREIYKDIKEMGQVTSSSLKGPYVVQRIKLVLSRLKKFKFFKKRR